LASSENTLMSNEVDAELVQDLIGRVATNVAMLVDREIFVEAVETERAQARPAGPAQVHISFKLQFSGESGEGHGCFLIPLPDAISLACYLMMFTEAEVSTHRDDTQLDQSTKDAMLELGNFIAAAVEETFRGFVPGTTVRSDGCQGVRADVRPALRYAEGDELIVGRARLKLHEFPAFELLAVIPANTLALPA